MVCLTCLILYLCIRNTTQSSGYLALKDMIEIRKKKCKKDVCCFKMVSVLGELKQTRTFQLGKEISGKRGSSS